MLYSLFIQFCYLVIWSLVFVGAVIFLRRGQADGAMPMLLGAGILVLMQILTLGMMLLQSWSLIEAPAASRMYQVMWVPQLAGGFLFAFGFLHLARTTKREE